MAARFLAEGRFINENVKQQVANWTLSQFIQLTIEN